MDSAVLDSAPYLIQYPAVRPYGSACTASCATVRRSAAPAAFALEPVVADQTTAHVKFFDLNLKGAKSHTIMYNCDWHCMHDSCFML